MIIIAVLCLIIPSIVWGIFILAFRLRAKEAPGVIVGQSTAQGKYGQIFSPIVEFQLPDGRKITFTEPVHSSESIFDLISDAINKFALKKDLDQVTVLYDPNNPEKARVKAFTYLYMMPTLLFVIGACMILYTIPAIHDLSQPILDFLERVTKFL